MSPHASAEAQSAPAEESGTEMNASEVLLVSTAADEDKRSGQSDAAIDSGNGDELTNNEITHGLAVDEQVAEPMQDSQLVEGLSTWEDNSAAAEVLLHSRWKRPCKRLVRFHVVAGEEEQRQIEALQDEYMRLNTVAPATSDQSHTRQQHISDLVSIDAAQQQSFTPSSAAVALEQTVSNQAALTSKAVVDTALQHQAPVRHRQCNFHGRRQHSASVGFSLLH